jgi:NADH-quinone oxidoreductase subunit A
MDYKLLFYMTIFSVVIGTLIILIPNFFLFETKNLAKLKSYECGFVPFEDSRKKFHINFYVVGVLFILFDIEIIFLFPWVYIGAQRTIFAIPFVFFFITILMLGFFYEWSRDAMEIKKTAV